MSRVACHRSTLAKPTEWTVNTEFVAAAVSRETASAEVELARLPRRRTLNFINGLARLSLHWRVT
ncbi:hypothetical protein BAY61_28550 [Prauserella marina]|nr:hypothetical protein BAY61_28550 [Prauserella marina]PWV78492.1 hypothetical protein DES30_104227 [Prauserella marina]